MVEFIKAALPWVAIGLSVAIVMANLKRSFKISKKGRNNAVQESDGDLQYDHEESDIEDETDSESTKTRMSESDIAMRNYHSQRSSHKAEDEYEENRMNYLPIGMCLGMCVGVSLGSSKVFDMGTGISMGMLFGLVIANFLNKRRDSK